MKISYKEYNEDLKAINEQVVNPMEKYSIEIEGEMKKPGALRVLELMDKDTTFEERAGFIKELLLGCKVTFYENNKKIFDIGITQGMQWWAVAEFDDRPFALKYLINSVYAKFLKNYAV